MDRSEHIIYSTSIQMEYRNKALAIRCNNLIESIFHSQILPEMEAAVSASIPKGINIELSKLEINIGEIPEKDLDTFLGKKIREELEKSLNFSKLVNLNGNSINGSGMQKINPDNALLYAFDFFLRNGFFPYALEHNLSLKELLEELILSHPHELTEVLFLHSSKPRGIQRLINNLNPQDLSKCIIFLEPENGEWIQKLVPKMLQFAENLKVASSQKELTLTLISSVIRYLLNNRSPGFSRQRFLEAVMADWLQKVKEDPLSSVQSIRTNDLGDQDTINILQTFKRIIKNEGQLPDHFYYNRVTEKDTENSTEKQLAVDELIDILQNQALKNGERNWVREEFLAVLQDTGKRKNLFRKLNEQSRKMLIHLLADNDAESLMDLVSRLHNSKIKNTSSEFTLNQLYLSAIHYLTTTKYHPKRREEFVVHLLSEIKADQLIKDKAFQNFWHDAKLNPDKLDKALSESDKFFPTSPTQDNIENQVETGSTEENGIKSKTSRENYLLVYYRKILGTYLQLGYLPTDYLDLTQDDVKHAFLVLIEKRENLLAETIRANYASRKVSQRLSKLLDKANAKSVRSYLNYFFGRENDILTQIISEWLSLEKMEENNTVFDPLFQVRIFIEAVEESFHSKDPNTFRLKLISSLIRSTTDNDTKEILSIQLSKILEENNSESSTNKDSIKLQQYFTHKIEYIISKRRNSIKRSDLKIHVEDIAILSLKATSDFVESLLQFREQATSIFNFFKQNLNEALQNKMQELIWSDYRLKEFASHISKEEKVIDYESDVSISDLSKTEMLALIDQARNDTKIIQKLVESDNGLKLIDQLKFSNKKINDILIALYLFEEKSSNSKTSSLQWKTIHLSFAFFLFENNKQLKPSEIAKEYFPFLFDQLKTQNKEDYFFEITQEFKDSKNVTLSYFSKPLNQNIIPDNNAVNETINEKTDEPKHKTKERINFHLSVLLFYSQTGYLPWWSTEENENDLLFELTNIQRKAELQLEQHLLVLQKDENIFTGILENTTSKFRRNFETIIQKQPSLMQAWQQAKKNISKESFTEKQSAKNALKQDLKENNIGDLLLALPSDDRVLLKAIYKWNDDTIISHWPDQRTEVKTLLEEYLSLTPFFFSRETTPQNWRKLVYKFSTQYFGKGSTAMSSSFHRNFLNFITESEKSTNWKNILLRVQSTIHEFGASKKTTFPAGLQQVLPDSKPPTSINDQTIKPYKMETSDSVLGVTTIISNAGLVLAWPFFTRLFESLNYAEQGQFVDDEHRTRAAYLLQFLAYNSTEFPEYELVLNKLLTGIPAEMHLEPIDELTEEEKAMTQSLLNGMIQNWDKVKNSTPEGIQETFIRREGMLTFKEDLFQLKVEKKGVDVLMQSIPWSFNTIKLPWMERPIHVEWI